ncbi:MAG TPA: APC family permease [Thermoanaerobaculia bacterium]|nr:APC family permease [Thermoanaerobaculia bacterium]
MSSVSTSVSPGPALERVLGRTDLVLFTVCAILTIDTLASSASMGYAWFSWWAITMTVFFIPYGLITAELGAAWPGEGGVYVWVREAFGPKWGSTVAWMYWINNAYWIPSVYLIFAGTFGQMFLKTHSPWQEAGIAIVLTWLTVGVGVVRLEVSKWVPNLGAVVKALIFLALGVLGLSTLFRGGPPANAFSAASLVPRWNDSLAYLPALLYSTFGFELMSSAGGEMRNPKRDVPSVILWSGALIAVLYSVAVAGIFFAVPMGKLSIVTGTWDALAILGKQWGRAGDTVVFLLGLGFLYACVANVVTWSLGANRVAAVAAEEGLLPEAFGRLHPRFKTPALAFVVMGLVSTALLVGGASLSSSQSNIFWMTFRLTALCLLLCYLLVFPAFLVLRKRRPEQPRPYRLPGGPVAAAIASWACTLYIFGACILFFVPSPTSQAPLKEGLILGGETLATVIVGYLLIPRRRPS